MDTVTPAPAVDLARARAATPEAPDVTLAVDADASLRLTVYPGGDGVGPFVALRLGPWVTVFLYEVEAADRLAALATEAAQALQRSGVPRLVAAAGQGPGGEEP